MRKLKISVSLLAMLTLVLILTVTAFAGKQQLHSESIISVEELNNIIQSENLVIIDTRSPAYSLDPNYSKPYMAGHIPGAVSTYREKYQDDTYMIGNQAVKGMIIKKEDAEKLFSSWGVKNNSRVVIYGASKTADSSRLFWIFKYYGHQQVQILDGGYEAWKNSGYEVTTEISQVDPAAYTIDEKKINTAINATKEDVSAAINSGAALIDARASATGRIKGCTVIAYSNNFNADGTFKSKDELEALYGAFDKHEPIIVYCNSGTTAATTWYVLTEVLKFKNVKLYDASWHEWGLLDPAEYPRQ